MSLTKLFFLRDSLKNTQILGGDKSILKSDELTNTDTFVYRGDTEDVVAHVNKRTLLPAIIRFGNQKSMHLSEWMKGATGSWTDYPVSFHWDSRQYTWQTTSDATNRVALFDSAEPAKPIAWFEGPHEEIIDGEKVLTAPQLSLEPQAFQIMDVTVVSSILFGQELRVKGSRHFEFPAGESFYIPKMWSYGSAARW